MEKIHFNSIYIKTGFFAVLLIFSISSCQKDLFNKQPLDAISDETFWKTEADANLALVGCYHTGTGFAGEDFWMPRALLYLDLMAGNGSEKELIPDHMTDGTLNSTYWVPGAYWQHAYQKITTCNNFLGHINDISIDAAKKATMIAEVHTIRAYEYLNLALYFGDVPLVQKVLTIDEANSVSRTPRQEVYDFLESDLKASYPNLPVTTSQSGKITKGAALALLGRLQMLEKKWTDAATTYKLIIDANTYSIDPKYKELFWEAGEASNEIILSSQFQPDLYNHVLPQYLYPETYGGWHQFSPYNELAKDFECTDGKTITVSPLYDKNNPYANRDPRLDYTLLISDRSVFKGITYISRPGTSSPDRFNRYNWSGYCISKFMDPNFSGSLMNYGGNFSIIRYAEVLLSYLESKMESGAAIDQSLLDLTINKVRGRAAVNMPPVTTTDPSALRTIIRRERRVEFAFEGLRYYDLLRWGTIATELNKQFTGMKLTNSPATYTDYPVDNEGYLIYQKRNFVTGKNELWPIPQSERDINKNLTQNPGY